MRNFLKIADNIGYQQPLLQELQRKPDLWNENTLRTKHPGTAHSQVSDIWVWFNSTIEHDKNQFEFGLPIDKVTPIINDKEVVPYRAWMELPSIRPILFPLMRQVEAVRIGRVIITKLPPGCRITPHVDGGAPATYFTRYQVALQCNPGNVFRIENETIEMRSGDIWMIDNKLEHEVINNSADDRIVMIVDLRSE